MANLIEDDGMTVDEASSITAPGAGKGKFWVKNDAPSTPQFTDDAGTDWNLAQAAGSDTTAIHDDTASEISAITEKASPVSADLLLIEDSADSNNKKRVQIGNLPGGGSHALLSATHTDTVANAVTRGSLVYGNATPAWDELVIGGANTVLGSDGTDASWHAATGTGSVVRATTPTLATSIIFDQTTADYTLTWADPGAARAISITDPGGSDSFVWLAATQTLTNKTLTTPTIASFTNATHNHEAAAGGGTLASAATPSAIHDDTSGEINTITTKGSPVGADVLIIEDSAASFAKKKITISTLPAGGEINDLASDGINGIADDQLAVGTGASTAAYQTLPNGAVAYSTAGGTFSQAASTDLSDSATLVSNDQANTYSTGAQNFAAASSLTVPTSAGAAPTASGQIAYDSTANQLEYGDNTVNRVVANLDEAQSLSNKTLVTPTIASFTNATHDHEAAAGGGTLASAATPTAIHDDTAGEINAITVKGSPVGADVLIIEDSAASFAKKKITISTLPAGGEINDLAGDGISGIADNQLAVGTGAGTAGYQTLPTNQALAFDGTSFDQATWGEIAAHAGDVTVDLTGAATRTLTLQNSTASQVANLDVDGTLFFRNNTAFTMQLTGTPTANRVFTFSDVASDTVALLAAAQTFTNKTLTTPTIGDFTNATHNHQAAAGGGTLTHNSATDNPTVAHGATGAVVGTTNTQTLTNKTLTLPIISQNQTLANQGELNIDTTDNQFQYRTTSATHVLMPFRLAGMAYTDPATADENIIMMTEYAITLEEVKACGRGGTSVAWELRFDTDADNVGTLIEGNTTTTNGVIDSHTTLTDATVPANQVIWVELDTVTGSVADFTIQFRYTVDAT